MKRFLTRAVTAAILIGGEDPRGFLGYSEDGRPWPELARWCRMRECVRARIASTSGISVAAAAPPQSARVETSSSTPSALEWMK
jgi:hypothetical protein